MERRAYVLDYLPHGRPGDRGPHRGPVAIALGEAELKLLEIVPRPGMPLSLGSAIPLLMESGVPPPIDHVRRRLAFDELTATARAELGPALEAIVRAEPARFLRFFNEAAAASPRFHLLELLPGIGKKTLQTILEQRKSAPFASFGDLEARVHLKGSEKLIVGRIEQEMSHAEEKYRLFVPS